MGGLFSSEPTPAPRPAPTRNYSYNYETQKSPVRHPIYSTNTNTISPRNFQYESGFSWGDFESLSIRDRSRAVSTAGSTQVQRRQVKPPVTSIRDTNRCSICSDPYFNSSAIVTYIKLEPYDHEYQQIISKITNKRKFKVDSIEKIENPYLKRAYQLKKEQKKKEYFGVEEELLFHGTTRANFDQICKFNFDYRLCKAHMYGKGVSFSPNANYASNYSDKNIYNKVMIVAKVLIGNSCIGNEHMVLPPDGCDTSQKGFDGIVIVKYEDNEFLPVYKINYHLALENVSRPRPRRGRGGGRFVPQQYFTNGYYDDSDDDFFD